MTTNHEPPDHPRLFSPLPYLPADQVGSVYAIQLPSHAIKIGWTGRSPAVRARELHGQLLAFMPGSLLDEAELHARLAPFRIGRMEDFWPAPPVWNAVDVIALNQIGRSIA